MRRGFVAMYSVLIVMAVILTVAGTVTLLTIGVMQGSLAISQGEGTLAFVEGCAEDALLKARADSAWGDPVGSSVNITRPEGTCQVIINSKVGGIWTMTVTNGTNTRYRRTIRVVFERGVVNLALTSWREE